MSTIWGKITTNKWIAMPYASERETDRWFLGIGEIDLLKKQNLGDVIITLLCSTNNDELIAFVIPSPTVKEILPYLSRSKGQYKFNNRRDSAIYELLLPGKPLDITGLKNNFTPFTK